MAAANSHRVEEFRLELNAHHSITPSSPTSTPSLNTLTAPCCSLYSAKPFSSNVRVSMFLFGHQTPAPPTCQNNPVVLSRLPLMYALIFPGAVPWTFCLMHGMLQ